MRWVAGFLLIVGILAGGVYTSFRGLPYRVYSNWLEGKGWNRYYQITNYRELYKAPSVLDEIVPYREDYVQLWKSFPLRNSLVPLPTRHPLYNTLPLIEFKDKNSPPQVGMILQGPDKREISRVYTLPTSLTKDHSHGQELFKLPFVRNRIMKMDADTVWKEIFTRKIEAKNKSVEEMIHDLYILHLRSRLLPAETLKYGMLKDGKALVELSSKDKDYIIELIMTQEKGSIYSYVLKTAKNNPDSLSLRSKFLEAISFLPIDSAMGSLLYKEFKQLNFARQVDQEGMLYLFSAWTQDIDQTALLKEMIFYLERGRDRGEQLKAIYQYAFKKYGKTFTTRTLFTSSDDPELVLRRKMEIEALEKAQEAARSKFKGTEKLELTPDERMNIYLKKAKEEKLPENSEMVVH